MTNLKLPLLLSLALATTSLTGCAIDDGTDDATTTSSSSDEVAVRPTFDLWKVPGGFRFALLASNGETLVTSQDYSTRTSALGGLLSVLDNGGFATAYQVTTAPTGEAHFDLYAANRAIIATSDTYASATTAQGGIEATTRAVAAYLEHWDTATGARFEVFESTSGSFYFRLYARNGAKVLGSEAYTSEAAALNGAFSVTDHGITRSRYTVTRTTSGTGWYFSLKAANGQVIGTSQVYSSKASAERGRDAIIALLPDVELL